MPEFERAGEKVQLSCRVDDICNVGEQLAADESDIVGRIDQPKFSNNFANVLGNDCFTFV
ncbi:hypothetical protein D3C87_2038960 [compost metagenome]